MMHFSIIVPLYNKEKFICRTLESILTQTYKDFELIVVNDGSTDNSEKEVLKIKDQRLRFIEKKNGGVSSARNRGILEARNEWIVFFDADDIMYPNALEEYVLLHQMFPNINVLCASIDASTAKFPSSKEKYIVPNYRKANIFSELRTGFSLLCTDCICVNMECFKQVGYFSEEFTHGEDLDLWERLNEQYIFAKSEVSVAYYDYEAENRSDGKAIKERKYAPASGKYLDVPSVHAPVYEKLIYGSKLYMHFIEQSEKKPSFIKRIRALYCLVLFVIVKVLYKVGFCKSRGIE